MAVCVSLSCIEPKVCVVLLSLLIVRKPRINVNIRFFKSRTLCKVEIYSIDWNMLNVRCPICNHVIVCQSHITKIQIDKAALLFCHVFHHHSAIHHIVRLSRDVNDLLLSVILLVFYPCNVRSCPSLVVQRLFWLSFLLLYSLLETSIDIKVLIEIHLLYLWSKISLAF